MAESLFAGGALWPCQSSHSSSWERGGTDVTFCPTPTFPTRSCFAIDEVTAPRSFTGSSLSLDHQLPHNPKLTKH
jgi:hypothetical protein